VKVRERSSFAFALVSAAVGVEMDRDEIVQARVAVGGVAHKPWRRPELEPMLNGEPTGEKFAAFARALTEGAHGYGHNDFKVRLVPNVVIHALTRATTRHGST
jgi:xanthine dehydrogenase YagS FAD-binding subunit